MRNSLNLIINATNIGKELTGIGRYSLSLVLELLRTYGDPFQVLINREAAGHFNNVEEESRIRILDASLSPDHGFSGHLKRLLWINRYARLNRDSVIFNTSPLESCFRHDQQIITLHDVIPLTLPKYHKKQYFYYKYALPAALQRSKRIIAISNYTKGLLLKHFKLREEKIRVIPYGISEIFFSGEVKKDSNYILYVGSLAARKNIERLIRAFEIVSKKDKLNLILKITANEKDLTFHLDPEIKRKIIFVGNVSEAELLNLYRKAFILVFPSLSEGFGFPPLEAMACGTPTVVSNTTAIPEVCGEAAYYVNPYNIENIAEAIYKVATNRSLYAALVKKGLQRARTFTWERAAKEHIEVFKEVMKAS